MKKILAAVLCAIGVTVMASNAFAVGTVAGAFMKYDNVYFRTSAATEASGYVDSLTAFTVGATFASSVFDTTAAIATEGWIVPMNQAASDTSGVFATLCVYDAPGTDDCQSGADSLAVAAQVSVDGATWVTAAAVSNQNLNANTNIIASRNNQTIINGAFTDLLSANGATVANGKPVWFYRFKVRAAVPNEAISTGSLHLWPYVRFILAYHDAAGYKVAAKIGHLQAVQP
jgi:hypothetical protein